jgi:hypothetical protein
MSIEQATAEVVADTEQMFAEALGRIAGELDRLAAWAAEHDRAGRGDLLAFVGKQIGVASRIETNE